jgi:hypothetical protein
VPGSGASRCAVFYGFPAFDLAATFGLQRGFSIRSGGTVQGSSEYVVAARAVAVYDALTAVGRERHFVVVHSDGRHLTLALRPGDRERSDLTVFAAVLDAGHGLSKLVLTGRDDRDGSTVGLADFPVSLFADIKRRLRHQVGARAGGPLVSR